MSTQIRTSGTPEERKDGPQPLLLAGMGKSEFASLVWCQLQAMVPPLPGHLICAVRTTGLTAILCLPHCWQSAAASLPVPQRPPTRSDTIHDGSEQDRFYHKSSCGYLMQRINAVNMLQNNSAIICCHYSTTKKHRYRFLCLEFSSFDKALLLRILEGCYTTFTLFKCPWWQPYPGVY